jgi:hypothetical protein
MAGRKLRQKGAALLDQKLVNDTLHWLRGAGYDSVLKPFEKGLHHLLEAHIKKDGLSDVITDMYEAVEALAKKATGRDKDLSENRELFISKVKASDHYKVPRGRVNQNLNYRNGRLNLLYASLASSFDLRCLK